MNLNEDNFMLYAAKAYDTKRSSGIDEFYSDLKRIQYVKRLLRRYAESGDLKVRLILNHVVVLYNCFGPAATHMMFFKLPEYQSQLKAFALFLNYLPEFVVYDTELLNTHEIPIDQTIYRELQKL